MPNKLEILRNQRAALAFLVVRRPDKVLAAFDHRDEAQQYCDEINGGQETEDCDVVDIAHCMVI